MPEEFSFTAFLALVLVFAVLIVCVGVALGLQLTSEKTSVVWPSSRAFRRGAGGERVTLTQSMGEQGRAVVCARQALRRGDCSRNAGRSGSPPFIPRCRTAPCAVSRHAFVLTLHLTRICALGP